MSESLRELVVRLSLDSGSFTSQIKAANTAVKQAEANFKLAGAGVKGFDGSLAGAKAKVEALNQKLKAQNTIVAKQKTGLDAAKTALEKNQKQQQELAQKINATKSAYDASVAATSKNSAASKELEAELKKLEGQQKAVEKQATTQATAVNKSELALTEASAAAKDTEAALKRANAEVAKASTVWARFGAATAGAQKALMSAGKSMSSAGRRMTMGVTLPIVAAGAAAVKASVDWESAFAGVQKTVDGTDQQMKTLHDGIIEMSKSLPTAANDIAKVAESAGQLGIKTDSILGFSRVMIDLGETTNLSADEAAVSLAQFANITQMSQTDFDRLGSVIVDLGNKFATTERDIVEMSTRLAGAGNQVKMSEANIMALAAAMASVGIEAEAGGSAMSKVMLNIDMAAAKGGREISKYAKISGMSAKEFTAAWKADPAQALTSFVSGLKAVEDSGGNVALTLADLGYKEVRTRDALLRLTGASDLMSNALGVANGAWSENVALTNEANKRYDTNASKLNILKNRAIAAGVSFGNAMTPHLEAAMGAITKIIDGFAKMDEGQQRTIITMLAVTAGVGPVLSGLGKLAQGASFVMKAFSGPAGWITLAVGALVGLGVYLNSIPSTAQKATKALAGITIGDIGKIDGEIVDQAGITAAINAGIDASKKEHAISVEIDADTSAIVEKVDAALSNGRLTSGEFNTISKFIKEKVNPDIAIAKKELDLAVADYKLSLDAAINAEGTPLTEDQKKELVDAFTVKNGQAITDLEAGVKEANRLLAVVRNAGSKATAEQIADLEAAIEKVGVLRKAIQVTKDEAIQAAKSDYNLTVSGGGNEKSAAGAVGYVSQTRANEIADAEAIKQTALAASVNDADAAAAAYVAYDAAVAAANSKAQAGYEAIASGVTAGSAGAQTLLSDIMALDTQLNQLNTTADLTGWAFDKYFSQLFGEGGSLSGFADDGFWTLYNNLFTQGKSGDVVAAADATDLARGLIDETKQKIAEQVALTAADPALNPLNKMLTAFVQGGAFQAIDPITVQGPLEDVLKLVDLQAVGNALGEQVPAGVVVGILSGSKSSFTAEELAPMKTSLENAVKSVLQIESPSKIMVPFGKQIPAGLAVGITENTGVFVGAIQALYTAAMKEASKQEIILRNHLAWLASTRPGPTADGKTPVSTNNYTDNLTVNANITNPTDIDVLAAQLKGRDKRLAAGYGGIA